MHVHVRLGSQLTRNHGPYEGPHFAYATTVSSWERNPTPIDNSKHAEFVGIQVCQGVLLSFDQTVLVFMFCIEGGCWRKRSNHYIASRNLFTLSCLGVVSIWVR